MGVLSGIGQKLVSAGTKLVSGVKDLGSKVTGAISSARQRRKAERAKPPQAPAGYREPTSPTSAPPAPPPPPPPGARPAPPPKPGDLPPTVPDVYKPKRDTYQPDYSPLFEHRDRLTTVLTRYNMPWEFIAAILDIPIEEYAQADFIELNTAMETLERYADRYENGTLPEFIDPDFLAWQVGDSLGLDYYDYGSASDWDYVSMMDNIPF